MALVVLGRMFTHRGRPTGDIKKGGRRAAGERRGGEGRHGGREQKEPLLTRSKGKVLFCEPLGSGVCVHTGS